MNIAIHLPLLVQWAHRGYHHDLLTDWPYVGHRTETALDPKEGACPHCSWKMTPRDQRAEKKRMKLGSP